MNNFYNSDKHYSVFRNNVVPGFCASGGCSCDILVRLGDSARESGFWCSLGVSFGKSVGIRANIRFNICNSHKIEILDIIFVMHLNKLVQMYVFYLIRKTYFVYKTT